MSTSPTLNRLSPFRDGTALVPPSEIETEMKAFLFSLVYSPLFEPPMVRSSIPVLCDPASSFCL